MEAIGRVKMGSAKRKLLRRGALLLGILLLLCAVVGILASKQNGRSAYEQITKGMTRQRILALLGPPSEKSDVSIPIMGSVPPPPGFDCDISDLQALFTARPSNWVSMDCTLVVFFDEDGKVVGKAYLPSSEEERWYVRLIRMVFPK